MKNTTNIRSFLALCWIALLLIITLLLSPLLLEGEKELADATSVESAEQSPPVVLSDSMKMELSKGKKLFVNNCATCHNKNMKDPLTGPALAGVSDRWSDFPMSDLFQWIRNSAVLIDEKHPRALSLWKEWNYKEMNAFPNLSDEDLTALLTFIER